MEKSAASPDTEQMQERASHADWTRELSKEAMKQFQQSNSHHLRPSTCGGEVRRLVDYCFGSVIPIQSMKTLGPHEGRGKQLQTISFPPCIKSSNIPPTEVQTLMYIHSKGSGVVLPCLFYDLLIVYRCNQRRNGQCRGRCLWRFVSFFGRPALPLPLLTTCPSLSNHALSIHWVGWSIYGKLMLL